MIKLFTRTKKKIEIIDQTKLLLKFDRLSIFGFEPILLSEKYWSARNNPNNNGILFPFFLFFFPCRRVRNSLIIQVNKKKNLIKSSLCGYMRLKKITIFIRKMKKIYIYTCMKQNQEKSVQYTSSILPHINTEKSLRGKKMKKRNKKAKWWWRSKLTVFASFNTWRNSNPDSSNRKDHLVPQLHESLFHFSFPLHFLLLLIIIATVTVTVTVTITIVLVCTAYNSNTRQCRRRRHSHRCPVCSKGFQRKIKRRNDFDLSIDIFFFFFIGKNLFLSLLLWRSCCYIVVAFACVVPVFVCLL